MVVWWQIAIIVILSYMCGNLSFARMIGKRKHADITKLGSGNPGTTNVLRNFGFKVGLINFILDILKGFVPTLVVMLVLGNPICTYAAGLSVILGHIYPVCYKFKGGKGIATMIGVFFATRPVVMAIVVVVAGISWLIFKYGSLASFICVTCMTVTEGIKAKATLPLQQSQVVCLLLFAIFIFTWFAHRKNIERLLIGKESKVDLIKSTKKKFKQDNKNQQ